MTQTGDTTQTFDANHEPARSNRLVTRLDERGRERVSAVVGAFGRYLGRKAHLVRLIVKHFTSGEEVPPEDSADDS